VTSDDYHEMDKPHDFTFQVPEQRQAGLFVAKLQLDSLSHKESPQEGIVLSWASF